jgi:hypothetical protein
LIKPSEKRGGNSYNLIIMQAHAACLSDNIEFGTTFYAR